MTKSSLVITLLLIIAGLTTATKIHYMNEEDRVHGSQNIWLAAASESQSFLSQTLRSLNSDQALVTALTSNQMHSLNQKLSTRTKQGYLEAIGLVALNCQPIAHYHTQPATPGSCPALGAALDHQHKFYYDQQRDLPALIAWQRLKVGTNTYWAYAITYLNTSWARRFHQLSSLLAESKIRIGEHQSSQEISIQILTQNPQIRVILATSYVMAPLWPLVPPVMFHKMTNVLIAFALVLSIMVLIIRDNSYFRERRRLSKVSDWLSLISNSKLLEIDLPQIQNPKGKHQTQAMQLHDQILRLLTEILREQRSLADKAKRAMANNQQLQREMHELRFGLAEVPFHQSLAHQVAQQSSHLQKGLGEVKILAQDIHDALRHGLFQEVDRLTKVTQSWRAHCQKQSPRSFLRHLSEREVGDTNQLEIDLTQIWETASRTANATINLAMQSSRLSDKSQKLQEFFCHQQAMSQTAKDSELASELGPVLKGAQDMIASQLEGIKIDLRYGDSEATKIEHLHIPLFAWQSLLYHTLLFLYYKGDKASQVGASSQQRWLVHLELVKQGTKAHLLIDAGKRPQNHRNDRSAQEHLNFAQQIAQSLPISLAPVPALNERLVLAISWEDDNPASVIKTPASQNTSYISGQSSHLPASVEGCD